jgi:hypothetical protein
VKERSLSSGSSELWLSAGAFSLDEIHIYGIYGKKGGKKVSSFVIYGCMRYHRHQAGRRASATVKTPHTF